MTRRSLRIAALLSLLVAPAACHGPTALETPAEELVGGAPFVPVYRDRSEGMIEARNAALATGETDPTGNHHFYLAIKKSELGQRWFLHAYLSQVHPGAVPAGAGTSVGTRVVSFRVQNGKLFLFDAADDKAWSQTFRPEIVLEAYPIVQGFGPFDRLRGASDYVLFDPAGGLNRFSLISEASANVKIELTFSQRFRKIPDGVTFDQVFTGTVGPRSVTSPSGRVDLPPSRMAGTLTLGLRRYAEGEGYLPTPLPAVEHFFRSPGKQLVDQGKTVQTAAKWNLRPTAKPVSWAISGLAEELRQNPELAEFDFAGAITAGIESWNEAFGWKALEARMARPDESFGDDDVNYFIFDSDRSFSAAFANWRSNPNNGEIRGASVYFPIARVRAEVERRVDAGAPADAAVPPPLPGPSGDLEVVEEPLTAAPRFAWGDLHDERLCELPVPSLAELLAADVGHLSRKERVERYIAFIAAHEVGHTLGLRHNFKGSLRPLTSSVMEYVTADDAMTIGAKIGSYDVAAIRYLYGLSSQLPSEPFCTDEGVAIDPDCRTRDRGSVPLVDWVIPQHRSGIDPFLAGKTTRIDLTGVDGLIQYARQGASTAIRLQALEALFAGVKVPTARPADAPADFSGRVDILARTFLGRLFPAPVVAAAGAPPPPPTPVLSSAVLAAAVVELEGNLTNADGHRTFITRRLAADILKRLQNATAHAALLRAREVVAGQVGTTTGPAAAEARDLLARLDRQLTPYFD